MLRFHVPLIEPMYAPSNESWVWMSAAYHATTLPEIVPLLRKKLDTSPDAAIAVLEQIGPVAEPLIPKLVEVFLETWKERDSETQYDDPAKFSGFEVSKRGPFDRMTSVLKTLENIGPAARQAVPLVRELYELSPLRVRPDGLLRNALDIFWQQLEKTRHAIDETPDRPSPDSKPLLGAFPYFETIWRRIPSRKGEVIQSMKLRIGSNHESLGGDMDVLFQLLDFPGGAPRVGHKDQFFPKQFSLREPDRDYQALGIYERNGDRLKIEFAKPGKPCPTEFSPDPGKPTTNHVLLEFERDRSDESKAGSSGEN